MKNLSSRVYVVHERFKLPPTTPVVVAAFSKYSEACEYAADMNKQTLSRIYNVEERTESALVDFNKQFEET